MISHKYFTLSYLGPLEEKRNNFRAFFYLHLFFFSGTNQSHEPSIKPVIKRLTSLKNAYLGELVNCTAFLLGYVFRHPEKIGEVCSSIQQEFAPQTSELLCMLTSPSKNIIEAYTIALLYMLGSKDKSYRKLIPKSEEYYVKKFTLRLQSQYLSAEEKYGILVFLRILVLLKSTAINERLVIVCLDNLKRGVRPPLTLTFHLHLLLDISKGYPQYLPTILQGESIIRKILGSYKLYFISSTIDAWHSILQT